MKRKSKPFAHTCTHNVISEKWSPEPERQHEEVAGEAGEQLLEACCIGTKVGKCSGHQHPVRMEANNIVLPGIQVRCLHQLGGRKEEIRSPQFFPTEKAANQSNTLLLRNIFHPFKCISNHGSKSCIQSIRNCQTLIARRIDIHAVPAHFYEYRTFTVSFLASLAQFTP